MIIDVTGFGWSGSGAFIDLLKEFEETEFPKGDSEWEFTILHYVDGIVDLKLKLIDKNCRIYDSEIAIKRFLRMAKLLNERTKYKKMFNGEFPTLCQNYLDSMGMKTIYAPSIFDQYHLFGKELLSYTYNRIIRKIFALKFLSSFVGYGFINKLKFKRIHNKRIIYRPDNYWERTQVFIESLLDILRKDKDKILVLNHFFSPDCPHIFSKYIGEPVKCIVVRRDPRDTYILAKLKKGNTSVPVGSVDEFIWFFKTTISDTIVNECNILNVQFEDLIYDYENLCQKIKEFTGLKNHISPLTYFKPDISIDNTQLFLTHKEYMEDILAIEKALPEALYDFNKFAKKPGRKNAIF